MVRQVPEWIGKTDDAPIPARVRLRVFDRYDGRCSISGRKINAGDNWHVDHIVALSCGGRHCESNLAPSLVKPHKLKTRADVTLKSTIYRKRCRHLGLKKSKRPLPGSRASGWKKCLDGRVIKR
jgi:5-methylcytosine-specific restriction protein A